MSVLKIMAFFLAVLVISFVSFYLLYFNVYANAQLETAIDSTTSYEAVTSVNDAILKTLIIISQVAMLGIIFNYFFFSRILHKKRDNILYGSKKNNIYFDIRTLKRVASIAIICCISIVIFSTGSILLQSYQLTQNLDLDIYVAFDISYASSIGQVWIIRVVTSAAIIGVMLTFYIVNRKRKKTSHMKSENLGNESLNKISFTNNKANHLLLLIVIVLSSVNLFSNSMISHSNSLPSLPTFTVFMDLIHFMAVSIWIGGLFYLSLIIVKDLNPITYIDTLNTTNTISGVSNSMMGVHSISITLMYFSFAVIIALGIIGITGLYLGYMHLQDLDSIFNTQYGQILMLKLALAFPLIFIGRYNQLKIYEYASIISNLLNDKSKNIDENNYLHQRYHKKRTALFRALNRSLKIESLLAIAVLIMASFLSVTSPPSLEAIGQHLLTMHDNNNLGESKDSLFFLLLIMALAVMISAIGIVNFRKNQKQIKTVLAISNGN
ncbi:MAG: CopD family protein [Thermoproteota archaeon]|nr:CopD family protein [Thermoproteota archaeon]